MKSRNTMWFSGLLLFALVALFSCSIKNNEPGNDNNYSDGSSHVTIDDNCVWGKGVAPRLLLDAYSAENLDFDSWLSTLYQNCEALPKLVSDNTEETAHEIVVGRTNRDIANKAYRYLEAELEDFGNFEEYEGWLIYTNGKSVSIAYDGYFAYLEAIKHFEENYLKKASFSSKAGVLASDFFETEQYVDEIREARREAELNALVPEIGNDTVTALKNLFTIYDDDLYKWLVDLYDPIIGGFYFSNSGRNTEGFLPDIESTYQAIDFLTWSGLVSEDEKISEAVPEEIGKKILAYAQSLQSPDDGYFYHPQWGNEISTSRLGRDLGWATKTISFFNGEPLYDTPNGVKGTLGAPGQNVSTSHLTSKLSVSSVMAVSKIVAASKASLPYYLKSLSEWDTYIKSLNIPYNSYHAGNTLASQHDQIRLAGQEYIDYLINYLSGIQNPKTALWEANDSENDDYYAVNGLMKLSALYNALNKSIPNIEAAIESCMSVILKEDGDTHVCSIYNPWITMYYMILSAERSGGEQKVEEIRDAILPKAAELIEATTKKIVDYRMNDGGFAYLGNNVVPANLSQGALVGCALDPESDVNATTISSVGIVGNIFRVLGCTEVKLYDANDYIVFKNRWLALGEIIKVPHKDNIVPVSFDDYDSEGATVVSGVVIDPVEYVQNSIGDYEVSNGNCKWFSAAVVQDPSSRSQDDLALRGESFVYSGQEKSVADVASFTAFEAQGITRNKNCYVFDGDIYFESFEGSTCVGQLFFASKAIGGDATLSLNVLQYKANGKTYVSIGENYQGLDGKKDDKVASGIPTGEWIRLRIEVYKVKTDEGLDVKCKVYVNGNYRGTCDAGNTKNGKFVDLEISAVTYSYYRHVASVVYFDDVSVHGINKEYVPEDDYTNIPEGPQKIDFEDYMTYGDTTYIYAPAPASPNAGFGVVTIPGADGKQTNAYVYDSNPGGKDIFRLQSYGMDVDAKLTSANAFTYNADMRFDFNIEAPKCQIELQIGSTSSADYHAYCMLISLDKESGKIALSDRGAKSVGCTVVTDVKNGEWFNIRVEYYYVSDTEMLALTYINDKLIYVSNNYSHENSKDSNVWPVFRTYTLPSGKEISGIEKLMFTTSSDTDVTVCLDNCIIRRTELTPPDIKDEDYTSRFDDENPGVGGGDSPSNPGDNAGSENEGGTGTPGTDIPSGNEPDVDVPGGDLPPPSQGDIIDNLPGETWKD